MKKNLAILLAEGACARPPPGGGPRTTALSHGVIWARCLQVALRRVYLFPGCVLCFFVGCFCFDPILWKRFKAGRAMGQLQGPTVPGRIGSGVGQMFFGGGCRSGGCFGTLGATVPQIDSLKDRGGPWAPPPLVSSSEFWFAIMSGR